ncbi:MAG: DUF4358 domain-containing protein [Ruminococcaceae bacterium]|nr:DUF4358 domain-containing protein [Oscillospiraceae bacterium]
MISFLSAKTKKQITAVILFVITLACSGCFENRRSTVLSSPSKEIMAEIAKNTVLEATKEYIPENPNSKDILKNYYNIERTELLDDFCILLPAGKNISEIAIFRFSSEEGRKMVEQAVKKRKEKIISICNAKAPAKAETAQQGEIIMYSNAVVMIITPNNNETVKNIIDNST